MTATQAEWERHVQAWQRSGQTQRAYATAHGLNVRTLRWWRRELAARPAVSRRAERAALGLQHVGRFTDGTLEVAPARVEVAFAALGATVVCIGPVDVATLTGVLGVLATAARNVVGGHVA